ncbi:MAG: SRPBCC family protein [Alphaproteobacteria bacterium]
MFNLSHTMAINDKEPRLTRAQIWQGLVLKAENPVPFLEAMSACRVIDRGGDWLLRDFTLRGEDMQERVTFEPQERVTFVRTKSSAMGTVMNEIVQMDDGEMGLRFTFSLDVDGLEDGSPEEAEFAERMSKSYFQGVESTLAEIRRRVAAGELDAA